MNEQCFHNDSERAGSGSAAQPRHVGAHQRCPRLASLSAGGRLTALAAAILAATVSVGSQIGLLALYSGEADLTLANLSPPSAASQVIASAMPVGRPNRFVGTKFDSIGGQRWPWEHSHGRSEE